LNDRIATNLEREIPGAEVRGDARTSEEWIPGPGGGREGGTFVDITAKTPDGKTIRVQTVDTLADGVTPTPREAAAAARIRAQFPGDELRLVPKPK
jgi:filamentous hemagglutinin